MKTNIKNNQEVRFTKKKLLSAAISLLIATVLIITSTFAWLTLSTAPEVTGIATSVGANGSLEIALLNAQTRADLTTIQTRIGSSSSVSGVVASNLTWGNIVDLSDTSYGLGEIQLMPSQLVVQGIAADGNGYNINPNAPITLPNYGTDGRITELDGNPVSAVYNSGKFGLTANQTYGVRALGTTTGSASANNLISLAKTYVSSYANSAKTVALSAINNNGNGLVSILITHNTSPDARFTDANVTVLKNIISSLQTSFSNIETSLRYGMIASAAANGAENITTIANEIRDPDRSISDLYTAYGEYCHAGMSDWITALNASKSKLNAAYNACGELTGNSYTWNEISPILNALINTQKVYIGDKLFSQVSAAELLASDSFTMSLLTGSGVFSDVADFTGDYSTWLNLMV
ncbi:MAG: hypothetical protein IKN38_05450, partial [Clostridia bacterium]|nr:hypothetical protein [Clostridia bacterium]